MNNHGMTITGFVPSRDLINYLREQLSQLEGISPYSSYILLKLEHVNEMYHAEVDVVGKQVTFKSVQCGESMVETLVRLFSDINHKLALWRVSRFSGQNDFSKKGSAYSIPSQGA